MEKSAFFRSNKKYCTKETVQAWFHIFLQETEETCNGNLQYAVAIIEYDDGTVTTVGVESIKFIKENENE